MAGAVLGLTAGLAACGSATPPQASDQPTVTVIEGTVATPRGAGTVSLDGMADVSVAVAADGHFSLSLPAGDALASRSQSASAALSGLKCAGALSSSDPAARGYLVSSLTVQDSAGGRSMLSLSGSKTGVFGQGRDISGKVWLYADRPSMLTGHLDCAAMLNVSSLPSLPVDVNINAKAGWNVIDLNIGASAGLSGLSGSGSAVNSPSSTAASNWRTSEELQAQLSL